MKILILLFYFIFSYIMNCYAGVEFAGDTSTNYISCGTNDAILKENGATTISFWIYPRTNTITGRIISRVDVSTTVGPSILLNTATTNLTFQVQGSTSLVRTTNSGVITLNTWQHVLVTWDGSTTASNVHIYINGVEAGYSTTTNGSSLGDNSAQATIIGNAASFSFGRAISGYVQDIHIWNAVLASEDIAYDYNGGKQGINPMSIKPGNLVRWWRLNECANGVVCSGANQFSDLSPSNVSCTANNSPKGKSPIYTQINSGTLYNATIN